MAKVHDLVVEQCANLDPIAQAHRMNTITDYPLKRKDHNPYLNRFVDFAYWSPGVECTSIQDGQKLDATIALRTYTTARIEHTKRVHETIEPFNGNRGLSMMLYQEIARLSKGLRARYWLDASKPDNLILAYDLSILGARFHEADTLGYSQTLSHWMHLQHNSQPATPEQAETEERRLRLCLALSELAVGPQRSYAHIVARDLIALLLLRGKSDEASVIQNHFDSIPYVKDGPGEWFTEKIRQEQKTRRNIKRRRNRKR